MAERTLVNPGVVAWAGDNPGIYLKETAEGDWTGLAVYFRIVYSPQGRGRAMVVLADWIDANAREDRIVVLGRKHLQHLTGLPKQHFAPFNRFRAKSGEELAESMRREGLTLL